MRLKRDYTERLEIRALSALKQVISSFFKFSDERLEKLVSADETYNYAFVRFAFGPLPIRIPCYAYV